MERSEPRSTDGGDLLVGRAPRGLQPFLLRHGRADTRNPSGVVLLRSDDGRQLRLQWDTLCGICEALLRSGDLLGA